MKRLIGITVLLAVLAVPAMAAAHGNTPHPSHKWPKSPLVVNYGNTLSDAEALSQARLQVNGDACGVDLPNPCTRKAGSTTATIFSRPSATSRYVTTTDYRLRPWIGWELFQHLYLIDVDKGKTYLTIWDLDCKSPSRCDAAD